jgi:WD40 repeat protein
MGTNRGNLTLLAAALLVGLTGPVLAGVTSVAVSATGTIVAGSTDGSARVWLSDSIAPAQILRHQGHVDAVDISTDGRLIVTGSADGSAVLWDASNGLALRTLSVEAPVTAVAFSAGGDRILTGRVDGVVQVWDGSGVLQRTLIPSKAGQAFAVSFSPDGSRILAGYKFEILQWYSGSGQLLGKIRHGGRSAEFMPDGKAMMVLSGWAAVMLVDTDTGGLIKDLPDNRVAGFILSLAVSPNGKLAATGRTGETAVEIWDLSLSAAPALYRILDGGEGWINAIAFAANGTDVVTGSSEGVVEIWDLTSGKGRRLRN